METNNKKVAKSVGWSAIERFATQGVQFVISFVVARQLLPADYGLIAMLAIFMALAQSFVDAGFSQAIIRKQQRTQTDLSTVFFFNIVIAAVLYAILALAGPAIAAFYRQPLLFTLILWVGLNIIISSFSIVQTAKLTIELDFKKQAVASLSASIVSGVVAIWMAYAGYGVWTLVVQGLLRNAINVIVLWVAAGWRPSLTFSMRSFREFFMFGNKILVGGIIHTLYTNIYTLIVGKIFQARELGLFGRAQQIAQFPSLNLTALFQRVVYPVECELQDKEDELQAKFFFFFKSIGLLVFPLMFILIALCDPLIRLILTDKWSACIPFVRILCLAYMWDTFMRLNWVILLVKGRTDYSLRSEIYKKVCALLILVASIPLGMNGICWGLVLYSFVDMFIITRYTRKVLPLITFTNELKVLLPILGLSLVIGLAVFAATLAVDNVALQTALGGATAVVATLYLIRRFYRSEFNAIIKTIR